jgi:hypothetical protein
MDANPSWASAEEVADRPAPIKRKSKKTSPTQRTLKHMRELGCPLVAVVEKWNPHARIRQDLFGVIDIVAITAEGETIGIQACAGAGGDVAARVRKIAESDALPALLHAHWRVVVHGWRKNSAGRWVLREIEL